jgi:hypothetical protein
MPVPEPFADDDEYLSEHLDYLASRVQRLAAAKELREIVRREPSGPQPGIDDDLLRRLEMFQAREDRQRDDLNARLQAHRADPGARKLGIDRLAEAHALQEEACMVLLSCFCSAMSEEKAEAVHGDLGVGMYGSRSVEGLLRLLDAQSIADRVRLRRLFSPEAPLVKAGLVLIDHYRSDPTAPEHLLGCRVVLSQAAWEILVGWGPVLTLVNGAV